MIISVCLFSFFFFKDQNKLPRNRQKFDPKHSLNKPEYPLTKPGHSLNKPEYRLTRSRHHLKNWTNLSKQEYLSNKPEYLLNKVESLNKKKQNEGKKIQILQNSWKDWTFRNLRSIRFVYIKTFYLYKVIPLMCCKQTFSFKILFFF